jgi:hypothetical protein
LRTHHRGDPDPLPAPRRQPPPLPRWLLQVKGWWSLQPGQFTCAVLTRNSTLGYHLRKGAPASATLDTSNVSFIGTDLSTTSFRPYNPMVVTRAFLC